MAQFSPHTCGFIHAKTIFLRKIHEAPCSLPSSDVHFAKKWQSEQQSVLPKNGSLPRAPIVSATVRGWCFLAVSARSLSAKIEKNASLKSAILSIAKFYVDLLIPRFHVLIQFCFFCNNFGGIACHLVGNIVY